MLVYLIAVDKRGRGCVACSIHNMYSMLAEKIPFNTKDGRAFTIAEYGCQDGGISVPVMQHLIGNESVDADMCARTKAFYQSIISGYTFPN